jgi:hypothetical protein
MHWPRKHGELLLVARLSRDDRRPEDQDDDLLLRELLVRERRQTVMLHKVDFCNKYVILNLV